MLKISNNGNIEMTRGEEVNIPVFIDVSDTLFKAIRYTVSIKDELIFHIVNPNMCYEHYIVGKIYLGEFAELNENKDLILKLVKEDTEHLPLATYFYQIKLNYYDKKEEKYKLITLTPRRKFTLR